MNTIARGCVAELMVATELTKLGLVVCLPMNHNSSYDLIADGELGLQRIQVKRAYSVPARSNGGKEQLCVETRRIIVNHSGNKGSVARSYDKDSFDYLIAVDVDRNNYWVIPFDITTEYKAQIYLRTSKMDAYCNQFSLVGSGSSS